MAPVVRPIRLLHLFRQIDSLLASKVAGTPVTPCLEERKWSSSPTRVPNGPGLDRIKRIPSRSLARCERRGSAFLGLLLVLLLLVFVGCYLWRLPTTPEARCALGTLLVFVAILVLAMAAVAELRLLRRAKASDAAGMMHVSLSLTQMTALQVAQLGHAIPCHYRELASSSSDSFQLMTIVLENWPQSSVPALRVRVQVELAYRGKRWRGKLPSFPRILPGVKIQAPLIAIPEDWDLQLVMVRVKAATLSGIDGTVWGPERFHGPCVGQWAAPGLHWTPGD